MNPISIDPLNFNATMFLEDLKVKNLPLKVELIKEVVVEMCTHKEASRLIQEKITHGTTSERNIIFEGMKMQIVKLSNESSGN